MQVVAVAPDGFSLGLLAKTCRITSTRPSSRRRLRMETPPKSRKRRARSAHRLTEPGAFHTLGKELPVYLTLRVGKFPDVMEQLARRHLDKGDEQSALVTCDLYKATFEGWGRPHWYLSQVYADAGRHEEARGRREVRADRLPVVHGGGAAGAAAGAVRLGRPERGRDRDVHRDPPGPAAPQFDGPKSDEQLAAEEAAVLLDKVYAGEMRLGEITQRLAKCYMDSDNGALAKLVMSSISI